MTRAWLKAHRREWVVDAAAVGVDLRTLAGGGGNHRGRCGGGDLVHRCGGDSAGAAVFDTDHGGLARIGLVGVAVAGLAADVRLVGLYRAVKAGESAFCECLADAVRQVPRRLLGDAQVGGELHRRPALRVRHNQEDRQQPRLSAQLRGVHEGVAHHREMLATLAAPVRHRTPRRHLRHPATPTVRTDRTARPAARHEPHLSRPVIGEPAKELREPHPGADDLMGFTHVPMIPQGCDIKPRSDLGSG